MKNLKIITTLIPLGLLLFVLTNCGRNYSRTIDRAYGLVDTDPDSALALLSGISNERLGHETARYALVYTIAQDKSGWDVDDDSLLHVAYAYYGDKPDDSLYAKCQYYTTVPRKPSIVFKNQLRRLKRVATNIPNALAWKSCQKSKSTPNP